MESVDVGVATGLGIRAWERDPEPSPEAVEEAIQRRGREAGEAFARVGEDDPAWGKAQVLLGELAARLGGRMPPGPSERPGRL